MNIAIVILYIVSLVMVCRAAWEKGFTDSAETAHEIVDELIRQYDLPKDCFIEAAKKLKREAEKEAEDLKNEE